MKTIITLLLAFTVSAVFAQTDKPKEQPKPVFQLPMDKDIPVTITFKLKAYELNDYIYVLQNGPQKVMSSNDLKASEATTMLAVYNAIADSVNRVLARHWLEYYKAQQKAFNDTIGKHGRK